MRKFLIAVSMFVLAMGIIACEGNSYEGQGQSQKEEASFTEKQQQRLLEAVPPPELQYSLERENLAERLTRFNDPGKTSYIYLISYGNIMAFYPMAKTEALSSFSQPKMCTWNGMGNICLWTSHCNLRSQSR